MSRVLIVNMPFSNLRWPNLGPSLLKAALARRGIGCDIAYFNFDFAEAVGLEHYCWLAERFAFVLGGERLFAKHYFGGKLRDDESYYRNVLLPADPELDRQQYRDYRRTERHVVPFLDRCISSIDWSAYDIVGFTDSFQQTMPSVCLARRIKQLRSDVQIVFGGSACLGEMGVELLRQFPMIDYVFLGEADLTFPPMVEQILQNEPIRLPPGAAGRQRRATVSDPSGFMVSRMDALPYPDFDDYFDCLDNSPLRGEIDPMLLFETSRGCWWGEKHHCKFCGLNGDTLTFRSKSAKRAVDELRYLVDRHDVHRACSTDNVLDLRYFDTFLPALKQADLDLTFSYEMKANLRKEQVDVLVDAGLGAAQLGIETFITPVLKLIDKGTGAMQNLQTLKWFSESGIEVKWNMLYGFPNENPDDYAALAELLPSLYHLAPPEAVGSVRMDRFAPYFENPAAYGMTGARPNRAFDHVYPFPQDVLARMAYYFEFDYADGRNPLDYAAPMVEAVRQWQQLGGTASLCCFDRDDGLLILTDTRPDAEVFQRRLTGIERAVYLFCDTAGTLRQVAEYISATVEGPTPDDATIKQMLDGWVSARIAAHLDNRYISLALTADSS